MECGALQLSLFDQRDMASITAPEFPSERLVVCRNPDLAAEPAASAKSRLPPPVRARIQLAVARKRNPLVRLALQRSRSRSKVINKH